MKKKYTWTGIGIVAFSCIAWLAIILYTGTVRYIDHMKNGYAYQTFFASVESFTRENDRLPKNYSELIATDMLSDWEAYWQEDSSYIEGLIQPDFSVLPNNDNLSLFAPFYESKAGWTVHDCEWYWERIVEIYDQVP